MRLYLTASKNLYPPVISVLAFHKTTLWWETVTTFILILSEFWLDSSFWSYYESASTLDVDGKFIVSPTDPVAGLAAWQ
jgi:hypothetical protein